MSKQLRFYSNLDTLMQEKGINQSDLSKQSKVAKSTLRNLTNGGAIERIDRSSTEKIISTLNCQFDDLWIIKWE